MQLAASMKRSREIRSNAPLTDDQIRTVAPSVFTQEIHPSMSGRYALVGTIDIMNGLREEGYQCFMAAQTLSRTTEARVFARHALRIRRPGLLRADGVNEIVLLNSHDGSSAYQMLAGIFRLVCMNGMVVGSQTKEVRIRHSGHAVEHAKEAANVIIGEFTRIDESAEIMRSITLSRAECLDMATQVAEYRWGANAPLQPAALLEARRYDDTADTLWNVMNRIQENTLKGGQDAVSANGRRMKTRGIKNLAADVKINRAIWDIAQAVAAAH